MHLVTITIKPSDKRQRMRHYKVNAHFHKSFSSLFSKRVKENKINISSGEDCFVGETDVLY